MKSHRFTFALIFVATIATMFSLDDFPNPGLFIAVVGIMLVAIAVIIERVNKKHSRS